MLSRYDYFTDFPGKDTEVWKGEVMCNDHMGGKMERRDLNPESTALAFHCTALWMWKAVFLRSFALVKL